MEEPKDILAILEFRMAELGMSQSQLEAKAFGRPGNTSIQSLKKGADPSYSRVGAMARALGLELYLGMPRTQGMAEPEAQSDFAQPASGRSGYLVIPWTRPGPGLGSSPVALTGEWLSANAVDPGRLSAIRPQVSLVDWVDPDRCVAILDARATRRGAGEVWCFDDGGKVTIGRLAFVKTGIVVMPAQLDQAPRVVAADGADGVSPIGRVVCLAVLTTA